MGALQELYSGPTAMFLAITVASLSLRPWLWLGLGARISSSAIKLWQLSAEAGEVPGVERNGGAKIEIEGHPAIYLEFSVFQKVLARN